MYPKILGEFLACPKFALYLEDDVDWLRQELVGWNPWAVVWLVLLKYVRKGLMVPNDFNISHADQNDPPVALQKDM